MYICSLPQEADKNCHGPKALQKFLQILIMKYILIGPKAKNLKKHVQKKLLVDELAKALNPPPL